ncbi:unnamed protein product, partial [Ectocarpus sp. 4 AP-2014]
VLYYGCFPSLIALFVFRSSVRWRHTVVGIAAVLPVSCLSACNSPVHRNREPLRTTLHNMLAPDDVPVQGRSVDVSRENSRFFPDSDRSSQFCDEKAPPVILHTVQSQDSPAGLSSRSP